MSTHGKRCEAISNLPSMAQTSPLPLQIAVYISGHGYGHFTRTINFISMFSNTGKYNFHIRTSTPLYATPLKYTLHPSVIQTNAYHLDGEKSLRSLQDFDPSLASTEETCFLKEHKIQVIISDAVSLPCLLTHSLGIPSILVTNFTFDGIFQALVDNAPSHMNKAALQLKVNEMSLHYGLAHTVIRLPGSIHFPFSGPQLIDAPMHFRAAKLSRKDTFAALGLQSLEDKKVLLHCFGGQTLDDLSKIPQLPEGWACISQTIDAPPFFQKISQGVYMPDIIAACDAVLGKLGWGTCSEVIGNGYKPFIYVPRSAFIEEPGLLSWMETAHRRTVRLEVEKYESSEWQDAIEEAYNMHLNSNVEENWAKNDAELVRIFEDTLESALKKTC